MQIEDFKAEIEILAMAYPSVFPEDAKKRGAMVIIWYDHFQHIPKDIFSNAAKYCREHERFLSIASLRESIMQVAGVPSAFEIKSEIICSDGSLKKPSHPMAKRIYKILELWWIEAEMSDFAFEREYARAREWWIEIIMQPENVGLLTGEKPKQLEGRE